MTTPFELLGGRQCHPLLVHAHPDDETLATGSLVGWLADEGVCVELVTCTHGERGEIVAGVLPDNVTTADLVRVRKRELACAIEALGVGGHCYLGRPPARTGGLQPRDYRDSGMRWVAPGLAGPAGPDDPLSFTAASLDEPLADLMALIYRVQPTVLMGYDDLGGYGHPDHLRAHELTKAAAWQAGLPLVEFTDDPHAAGFEWFDLSGQREKVMKALRCYATQLTVHDDHLVHVGGQRQELPLGIGLRTVG